MDQTEKDQERLAQEDQERRWRERKNIERKNDAESYKGSYWLGSIRELIEDG